MNGANLPANVPDLFANTQQRTSGPPCIVSPEPNTLVPRNWLRPRFSSTSQAQENTFEIILTVAAFAHPLRIYTAGDPTHAWHNQDQTYALPGNLWDELRASVTDQPITVQVRAMTLTTNGTVQLQPSPPSTSTFTIAPVDAPGKIVYWSLSSAGLGSLKGFGIGEEGVASVLVPGQVQASDPTVDDCIGCHSATPDGFGVGMVLAPSNNAGDAFFESLADIRTATLGMTPSYLDPGALATLRQLKGGTPTYSLSHWLDGDYISLTSSDNGSLTWVQLDSPTAQGTLARTGDPSSAATEPTFSHDGNTVVYVSGSSIYEAVSPTARPISIRFLITIARAAPRRRWRARRRPTTPNTIQRSRPTTPTLPSAVSLGTETLIPTISRRFSWCRPAAARRSGPPPTTSPRALTTPGSEVPGWGTTGPSGRPTRSARTARPTTG